jgi:hypothetical protein
MDPSLISLLLRFGKLKLNLNVGFFAWLVLHNMTLTADNMLKKN